MPGPIFTFGSNLAGRHGKGAAKYALDHYGAIYGQGEGRQGDSYAIPTKDGRDRTIPLSDPSQRLSLEQIRRHVHDFLSYADLHPELTFELTPIGCGLAGYQPEQIAPMFAYAPPNVELPESFRAILERLKTQDPP
jgi:hypothetical protein